MKHEYILCMLVQFAEILVYSAQIMKNNCYVGCKSAVIAEKFIWIDIYITCTSFKKSFAVNTDTT